MILKDFNEIFAEELRDPEFARAYLSAVLEDGDYHTFLVALRNVVQARGGMSSVSRGTSLGRESLYKSLSDKGNPRFSTVESVLRALGYGFSITSRPHAQSGKVRTRKRSSTKV